MRKWIFCLLTLVVMMWPFTEARGEQPDLRTTGAHLEFSGHISKIQSGLLFVKTPYGLQPRTISPNKADRVGLHQAKIGDSVLMLVDSGNVLLDAASSDRSGFDHRMIAGRIQYADPYWGEIRLSTPEGFERFDIDALAGSKLSMFSEGTPVMIELDADNVMVDIHPQR